MSARANYPHIFLAIRVTEPGLRVQCFRLQYAVMRPNASR